MPKGPALCSHLSHLLHFDASFLTAVTAEFDFFSAAPRPVSAGQAHSVLDGDISSFSLSDLHVHIGQSPGAAYAPRVARGRQKDGEQLARLPRSFPTTTAPGSLPSIDPRQCCVYTPNTPSATNHALPEPLLGETVTSLEKQHFRSQTPQPSKATEWRAVRQHHSLQLLFHCHREGQVITSAPSTAVSSREKDYKKDRESFRRALTR